MDTFSNSSDDYSLMGFLRASLGNPSLWINFLYLNCFFVYMMLPFILTLSTRRTAKTRKTAVTSKVS